jgi:hypothetical protein
MDEFKALITLICNSSTITTDRKTYEYRLVQILSQEILNRNDSSPHHHHHHQGGGLKKYIVLLAHENDTTCFFLCIVFQVL